MYQGRSEKKYTILGISVFKVIGITLLALAVSIYFNFNQYNEVNNLNYQLSEEGITIIIEESEGLKTKIDELRQENKQLQQGLADARQEILTLKGELEEAELEHVDVIGHISNKVKNVLIWTRSLRPLEIEFVPISGEGETVTDDELEDSYYSVSLRNYQYYKIRIKYETLTGFEWDIVYSDYPVYSEEGQLRQDW